MTKYAKTVIGAILALATWGITASSDGVYEQAELWGGLAAVATAVGVYLWPNRAPSGEPERGASDIALLIVGVLLVILVLVLIGRI